MSWWEHFITNNCFWKTLHTLVYHFLSPSARTLEVCHSSELPGSSPRYLVAISSLIINEAAYPWVSRFLTRKAAVTMIHCFHFCVAEVQKKILEAGKGKKSTMEDKAVEKRALSPFIIREQQNPARLVPAGNYHLTSAAPETPCLLRSFWLHYLSPSEPDKTMVHKPSVSTQTDKAG